METLAHIPVKFDKPALMSRLLIESREDIGDFDRLVESAAKIANPKALFDVCYIHGRTDDTVFIADAMFASRALRINTSKVERVFPFVCTCGTEFDLVRIPPDDILKQYWLDELKAAALRAARDHLFAHLKKTFGLHKIASMSPGSGDREVWPIEQQRLLFSLLGDTQTSIGVRLTDSFLMIPNKSVSGIAYPSEVAFETCRLCHRATCPGRRAPFDETLYDRMMEEKE